MSHKYEILHLYEPPVYGQMRLVSDYIGNPALLNLIRDAGLEWKKKTHILKACKAFVPIMFRCLDNRGDFFEFLIDTYTICMMSEATTVIFFFIQRLTHQCVHLIIRFECLNRWQFISNVSSKAAM